MAAKEAATNNVIPKKQQSSFDDTIKVTPEQGKIRLTKIYGKAKPIINCTKLNRHYTSKSHSSNLSKKKSKQTNIARTMKKEPCVSTATVKRYQLTVFYSNAKV